MRPGRSIPLLVLFAAFAQAAVAGVLCPATLPAQGSALRAATPAFPANNWWNTDVTTAPVDAQSASYIAFINNGSTRKLHPDFGGAADGTDVYGFPYAVVAATQPKLAVQFDYADESDGVNHTTGAALAFYPLPAQAITQPHWIEGGAPGNVDQRSDGDRHLLVIDCASDNLYELYNVWYDTAHAQWYAGSGAFFDMGANTRRPDGWTSADAAGLAIFPGLVRYDEAWNGAVTDIGHAFRVTVRASNGYVYPASHDAGSTAGSLPMGARLRLKALVNGSDPAARTTDPNVQKIFRAMQKYGLIVADNGSDMYISGTFDTRWDNDILNPAFALLSASDFDVVQLGWQPSTTPPVTPPVVPPPVAPPANTPTVTVVEYQYPAWGYYFITANPVEISVLDNGIFPGWQRTGQTFLAYPLTGSVGAQVCRFFTVAFPPKSSHFYTAITSECSILLTNPDWQFETMAFKVLLPAADGSCVSGTQALYRLYNNGQGGSPNHRYTTSLDIRAQMIAQGWIPEGFGPLSVNACVPG